MECNFPQINSTIVEEDEEGLDDDFGPISEVPDEPAPPSQDDEYDDEPNLQALVDREEDDDIIVDPVTKDEDSWDAADAEDEDPTSHIPDNVAHPTHRRESNKLDMS
ncbi:uncharacterized protein MELLADRAFT_68882 [Melampsora larici-populina 98AG31]|uniref:Uncharacterized protein n=1 Tax=Melampsora larici-populina (strain 98AG31 / pathotype 3-4-7) TaxID=747676 RepID=F4S8L6_MELLP|nr:uncharacterized protein MELLADRAFT_68882 [Melampsora larici-populina 98AG31]EGF99048.1 hypothetical protein MELLADRAFT_68882 [Melampsora larici-populina 98AG31]